MMATVLPKSPNIEHLRKEAKSILKKHRAGNPTVCGILKNLHHLNGKSNSHILGCSVQLSDIQFALALEYGFESWPDLVRTISAGNHSNQQTRAEIPEFAAHYVDRHMDLFSKAVVKGMEASDVRWTPGTNGAFRWSGFEFLKASGRLPVMWDALWPRGESPPEWDIMGRVRRNGTSWERVFVWCVAQSGSVAGNCPATDPEHESAINQLMTAAKSAFKVPEQADWMHGYYPYALHLAALGFLRNSKSCGHMLYVFGTSTDSSKGLDEAAWKNEILDVHNHLGLTGSSTLERRFHRYFLPIV